MNKLLKVILSAVLGLIGVIILAVAYFNIALPRIDPPMDLTVESTDELVARGAYLSNHVTVCIDCHSERNWNLFSGPIISGTEGQGGEIFDESMGLPGRYTARNITPHGIGNWSDGEVYRAITGGVDRAGEPLFPIMPYPYYKHLDRRDVMAIIAYLRQLKPIASQIDPPRTNFPMNLIMRTIPGNAPDVRRPAKTDSVEYGKYITTIAGCAECHTPQNHGQPVEGFELAGGFEFPLPTGGTVRSANITPDPATGIGNWSADAFVARFEYYAQPTGMTIPVAAGQFNTVMPWTMYGGMDTDDLRAMYHYLRTITPVANQVIKFTPASATD